MEAFGRAPESPECFNSKRVGFTKHANWSSSIIAFSPASWLCSGWPWPRIDTWISWTYKQPGPHCKIMQAPKCCLHRRKRLQSDAKEITTRTTPSKLEYKNREPLLPREAGESCNSDVWDPHTVEDLIKCQQYLMQNHTPFILWKWNKRYNKSKLQMKVTLAPVHRAPLLAVHPAGKGVPFATHLAKVHTYRTSGEQDSPCTSDSMEIGSGPFRKFNKKSVCNLFSMPLGDLVWLSQS